MSETTTLNKYKYAIKEKLNSVTNGQEIKIRLINQLGVDYTTMQRWINIPIDSKQDVPAGAIVAFAREFGCEISELINEK